MKKKITYSEPAEFFPKSLRKELGLGEYAKKTDTKKTASTPAKKKVKRK